MRLQTVAAVYLYLSANQSQVFEFELKCTKLYSITNTLLVSRYYG